MSVRNKALIFTKTPTDFPVPGGHLVVDSFPFDVDAPPPPNGLILESIYSSFEPCLRASVTSTDTEPYIPPFDLNQPITTASIAKVLKSDNSMFKEGDLARGTLPLQGYFALDEDDVSQLQKLNNPLSLDIRTFIGPLGLPGLAAYSSLYDTGQPKTGEVILVSGAIGGGLQLVGQFAKYEGLKVIGCVGSDDDLDFMINDLGFDGGFNYRRENPYAALHRLAPEGLDIYYQSIGGEILEAALSSLNNFSRIVVCDLVSVYNEPKSVAVRYFENIVRKRLTVRGLFVGDKKI
ncbi:hypothetical protein BDV10DRAFT_178852, partial [Aspergillus recurvatus]